MSVERGREEGFLTFFPWKERISDSEPSKGGCDRKIDSTYKKNSIFNIQIPVCLCYFHPSVKRQGLACEERKVFKLANTVFIRLTALGAY